MSLSCIVTEAHLLCEYSILASRAFFIILWVQFHLVVFSLCKRSENDYLLWQCKNIQLCPISLRASSSNQNSVLGEYCARKQWVLHRNQ